MNGRRRRIGEQLRRAHADALEAPVPADITAALAKLDRVDRVGGGAAGAGDRRGGRGVEAVD